MTSDELIKWFWREFEEHPPIAAAVIGEGLCQCATEDFINRSDNPDQMRAFLLLGVFLDQMTYTHYREVYENFRFIFRYPKLGSHAGVGMASPSWFVYSFHGYDKKMDWLSANDAAHPLFLEFLAWLTSETNSDEAIGAFMKLAEQEIITEFEPHTARRFWKLINSVAPKNEVSPYRDLFGGLNIDD